MTEFRYLPELEDSYAIINDPASLRRRWESDGCLFFRSALDQGAVSVVREQFKEVLVNAGIIDVHALEPEWTGIRPSENRPCDVLGNTVWRDLASHPTFDNTVRKVLGEAPWWVPIVAHRSGIPDGELSPDHDVFKGRHQDGFFNEGIEFAICWVPLMHIEQKHGGLAVALGTRQSGYLHDPKLPPMYPIPPGAIADSAWRSANYRPGDLLIFHYMTAHAALPNTTNRVRLSLDLRVLPASARRPIIGTISNLVGGEVSVLGENGEASRVVVNDATFVRGLTGARLQRSEYGTVLRIGKKIIATTGDGNYAAVVRSMAY
jgi:Phytanoyl-CoA dioxygenase (PhyH)